MRCFMFNKVRTSSLLTYKYHFKSIIFGSFFLLFYFLTLIPFLVFFFSSFYASFGLIHLSSHVENSFFGLKKKIRMPFLLNWLVGWKIEWTKVMICGELIQGFEFELSNFSKPFQDLNFWKMLHGILKMTVYVSRSEKVWETLS
jgi:hypothetical protein